MGLFSKIKSRLGRLGLRASKIGARFVSRFPPRTRGVLGKITKIGIRTGRFAFKFGRLGTPIGAALTALSVGGLIASVRRRRKEKKRLVGAPTVGRAAGVARGISRTAKLGLIGAAIGAAAFVGEQIAEKLGVRGGAGFVGRRPKVPGAPRRARRRRKRKPTRIRRHRHKIVRLKARTVVRSVRAKRSRSRKGKRVSFTTKTGQRVSFVAKR